MGLQLDPWQREFLETEGDKILYCGRQVGKSTICAIDAGTWAVNNPGKNILMIAPVERQSYALFEKTLIDFLIRYYPKMICKGKDRPTQTRIKLTNKTTIWCLPAGIDGTGLRFIKVDRLYLEEGARIPSLVFSAITPTLLTTGGAKIILTTPAGKGTYASDVWNNKNKAFNSYKRFSISSIDVIKDREICDTWTTGQREAALRHIEEERARMSYNLFMQEYGGMEMDALTQFFPDNLIKSCMTIKREDRGLIPQGRAFMGVDVAGMGHDQTVLFSVCKEGDRLAQFGMEITEQTHITDTIRMIKASDSRNKYKKIYIDDGGLGVGVFDTLLEDEQTRRKVEAINNSRRSLDREEKQRKRIMKEDLYNNLKVLMEAGRLDLWEDEEIFLSLKSIFYEWENGNLKISGSYSHIAEALIRAAWCVKDKTLNIWAAYKHHGRFSG